MFISRVIRKGTSQKTVRFFALRCWRKALKNNLLYEITRYLPVPPDIGERAENQQNQLRGRKIKRALKRVLL